MTARPGASAKTGNLNSSKTSAEQVRDHSAAMARIQDHYFAALKRAENQYFEGVKRIIEAVMQETAPVADTTETSPQ